MANSSTIEIPVSIGDEVYEKIVTLVSCRYWGDEYSRKSDGYPNCTQHEYDCCEKEYGGNGCDAKYEYSYKPKKIDDDLYRNFVDAILRKDFYFYEDPRKKYLLSEEEAKNWVALKYDIQKRRATNG